MRTSLIALERQINLRVLLFLIGFFSSFTSVFSQETEGLLYLKQELLFREPILIKDYKLHGMVKSLKTTTNHYENNFVSYQNLYFSKEGFLTKSDYYTSLDKKDISVRVYNYQNGKLMSSVESNGTGKKIFHYDDTNRLLQEINYGKYNENKDEVEDIKEYKYNSKNQIIKTIDNDKTSEFVYDTNNRVIQIKYFYVSDPDEIFTDKFNYQDNTNHSYSSVSMKNGVIISRYKYKSNYDEKNNVTDLETETEGMPLEVEKNVYVYDRQGNISKKETYHNGKKVSLQIYNISYYTSESIDDENLQEVIPIEKVLEKQLKQGTTYTIDEVGAGSPKVPFEMQEVDAMAQIVNNILKSNGFKKLSNENFNLKIKDIFERIINPNSQNKYLYINHFDKCIREIIMYKSNGIDYSGTFIDKKGKMISDFYYIPEIIYYQKEFPKLIDNENSKIVRKSSIDDLDIEIPHWKEVSNLKEIRKKNIQTLVARNMYLFNDNKTHFKWLILNDQYFMESLVKTFGYTQDLDLLKWVVEKTKFDKNNPQDYGKLFWIKQCDGTLKLHANTFKILQKIYTPDIRNDMSNDNRFLLDYIKDYIEYLAHDNNKETNISNEDRIKILANISYYAEQYKYDKRFVSGYGDNSMIMGRLRFFLSNEDVEILKKNNYFGLPRFREWWDNADYDEYYVSGEYNGEWGTINHPLSSDE